MPVMRVRSSQEAPFLNLRGGIVMEDKKNSLTPEQEAKVNAESKQALREFEFACGDPRGGIGFVYTERLRSLLRRKVVELNKYEKAGADKETLRTIGVKYNFAADEIFRTAVETMDMLRVENFRKYREEIPSIVDIAFGAYNLPVSEDEDEIWEKIKNFYADYCGDSRPLKIILYRGCHLPELENPFHLSTGIVAPKSMRKISEFFGLSDPVVGADATEYMDLDAMFDWDYEIMRTVDVTWLFNIQDSSQEADLKLKACFDYGDHPWFDPGKWYKNLSIEKFSPSDEAEAREILE